MDEHSEPTRLTLLTFDPPTEPPVQCTGGYVCECMACDAERAALARRGARGRQRQPWDTREAA